MNLLSDIINAGKSVVNDVTGNHPTAGAAVQNAGRVAPSAPGPVVNPGAQIQPGFNANTGGVPQGTHIQVPQINLLNALRVQSQHSPLNLGIPYGIQPQLGNGAQQPVPGAYNPGFTPLQNGFNNGPFQAPQQQSYMAGQGIQGYAHVNPQLSDTGYFWQQ